MADFPENSGRLNGADVKREKDMADAGYIAAMMSALDSTGAGSLGRLIFNEIGSGVGDDKVLTMSWEYEAGFEERNVNHANVVVGPVVLVGVRKRKDAHWNTGDWDKFMQEVRTYEHARKSAGLTIASNFASLMTTIMTNDDYKTSRTVANLLGFGSNCGDPLSRFRTLFGNECMSTGFYMFYYNFHAFKLLWDIVDSQIFDLDRAIKCRYVGTEEVIVRILPKTIDFAPGTQSDTLLSIFDQVASEVNNGTAVVIYDAQIDYEMCYLLRFFVQQVGCLRTYLNFQWDHDNDPEEVHFTVGQIKAGEDYESIRYVYVISNNAYRGSRANITNKWYNCNTIGGRANLPNRAMCHSLANTIAKSRMEVEVSDMARELVGIHGLGHVMEFPEVDRVEPLFPGNFDEIAPGHLRRLGGSPEYFPCSRSIHYMDVPRIVDGMGLSVLVTARRHTALEISRDSIEYESISRDIRLRVHVGLVSILSFAYSASLARLGVSPMVEAVVRQDTAPSTSPMFNAVKMLMKEHATTGVSNLNIAVANLTKAMLGCQVSPAALQVVRNCTINVQGRMYDDKRVKLSHYNGTLYIVHAEDIAHFCVNILKSFDVPLLKDGIVFNGAKSYQRAGVIKVACGRQLNSTNDISIQESLPAMITTLLSTKGSLLIRSERSVFAHTGGEWSAPEPCTMDMRPNGLYDTSTLETIDYVANLIFRYSVLYYQRLGNDNSNQVFLNGIVAVAKLCREDATIPIDQQYDFDFTQMIKNAYNDDAVVDEAPKLHTNKMMDRLEADLITSGRFQRLVETHAQAIIDAKQSVSTKLKITNTKKAGTKAPAKSVKGTRELAALMLNDRTRSGKLKDRSDDVDEAQDDAQIAVEEEEAQEEG